MTGDSVWLPISIFLVSTWLKFKMASASAKILQLLKPPWLTKCRYWSNTCTASCPTLRHSKSTFYALNIRWPKLWTTKYMQVGIVSVNWEWHTHPTKRYISLCMWNFAIPCSTGRAGIMTLNDKGCNVL